MSCLPADTFSHFEQRISNFEQREQEILARDAQIEAKRVQVISQATSVMQEAEGPILVPKTPPQNGAEVTVEAASPSDAGLPMDQGVMPTSMGGSEALHTTIRLQNARILQLSEELDKAISETCQKDSEVQQLRQEQKQVNDEVKRLQKTNASLEQNQEKMKKQLSSAESRVKELELERAELMKVKDHLDLKVKKTEADSSSKEARLNRLMEESEKLKAAAKDANLQERDRVSSDRREVDRLTNEVRKLERQRTELVGAFKKQMKLIEVLKRQRAHMEAAKVLSFTEDEFIRILELGENCTRYESNGLNNPGLQKTGCSRYHRPNPGKFLFAKQTLTLGRRWNCWNC